MSGENERIQTVVFMRHGVAAHNLLDPVTGQPPDIHNPSYWDPPLVERGMREVMAVKQRIQPYAQQTQLVITSPLTRCMQTSHLVFFPGTMYDNNAATTSSNDNGPPPLVCLEYVREAAGMHYPDRRRDKKFLQKHWPFIHFDPAMTDHDEIWKVDSRESSNHVISRVNKFFSWIVNRQENFIFTVSHGVWIEICLHEYYPDALKNGARVYNCDCFLGEVVSKNGSFVRLQKLRKI